MAKAKEKVDIKKLREQTKDKVSDKAVTKPVDDGFRSILTLVK